MKKVFRFAIAGLGTATLFLGAPLAGPALATHVVCGQVITSSTTLDSDVGPCAMDGIVIGADNITLDLNGHTLSGIDGQLTQGVGVKVSGHTGVVVTGGTVKAFSIGVNIENGASNTVSNMSLTDNTSGDGVSINGATADNNSVLNSYVARNGQYDGIGVYGGSSLDKITGTVITGNQVVDNASSGMTGGIRLENWTWNTTVTNNTVKNNALEGIAAFADTAFNTITGNVVDHNGFGTNTDKPPRPGDGIRAFSRSNNNLIQNNTVKNNAGNGIFLQGPVTFSNGTVSPGAANNRVLTNTSTNNNQRPTLLINTQLIYFEGRGQVSVTVNGQTTTVPTVAPAYDLNDGNANCGTNTWSGNVYITANPACTTNP